MLSQQEKLDLWTAALGRESYAYTINNLGLFSKISNITSAMALKQN